MKRSIALLLLFLHAEPALADLTYIPRWHMRDGEACFGFADAKTLLLLDERLVLCNSIEKTERELRLSVGNLEAALGKKSEALTAAMNEASSLEQGLTACIDEKAKAQAKGSSGPSLGWLVALGLSLVLSGIALDRYVIR
jgi:hypothetical protein